MSKFEIPNEIVKACDLYRQSIWDYRETAGTYHITGIDDVLVKNVRDLIVFIKKDDGLSATMLATDFLKAIIVPANFDMTKDLRNFERDGYSRVIDLYDPNTDGDYILPSKFQVIGIYETIQHGETESVKTLIILDK